jgi:two-component system response regulator DevR
MKAKTPLLSPPIRLVIVDDSELVRLGLRTLLEDVSGLSIVGEAATAASALTVCAQTSPDIALLDVRLPDGDGREVCRRLLAQQPALRVLFLTSADSPHIVDEAIRAGAHGYLLKEINGSGLVRAIREVAAGQSILDPLVTARVLQLVRDGSTNAPLATLSPQEHRVLALIATGKTNKEAAAELNLSEKTVKNYLSNIFDKLHITRRAQAAALYAQAGPKPGR